MKKAWYLFLIIGFLSVMGLSATDAKAELAWYTSCVVDEIGPASDPLGEMLLNVRLTDTQGSFSQLWFRVPRGQENQYLAIFLTTMTNNWTVKIYVDADGPTIASRTIDRIYLVKPE